MGFWDKFVGTLKSILDWLGKEENIETVSKIAKTLLSIIMVIGKVSSTPLSNERKRELAHTLLRFFKHASPEQLEAIMQAKRDGFFDGLEAWDMDALIGPATAHYVREEKENGGVPENYLEF